MERHTMRRREFGTLALGAIGAAAVATPAAQAADWTYLWDSHSLDGWTTWMRQPDPASSVPGLGRDAVGRYTEPIGAGRDPLRAFTVVADVDGRPAIRISGEVFGELRTTGSYSNYHLRLQFKWGEKKWPPRAGATTPRDSGLLYHVHAAPGAEGRVWARSVELQIQEHDVGDLSAIGSTVAVRARGRREGQTLNYTYDPSSEWTYSSLPCGVEGLADLLESACAMASLDVLADTLFREEVARARAMPPAEKLLEGPRLFERSCRLMADGVRHRHPGFDDSAVRAEVEAQLARVRAIEVS